MANHSSILAWGNPWTEKPGRVWPTGSQSDMTEVIQHACDVKNLLPFKITHSKARLL